MSELYFKINGLTKKRFNRWRIHKDPSVATSKIAASKIVAWCAVAATVVYSTGVMTNVAEIDGVTIKGTNVLVVKDTSGSMDGSGRPAKLEKYLKDLKESGMEIKTGNGVTGFGVSASNSNNLLGSIENGLKNNSNVDTIYAYSDFEATGDYSWSNDNEGYRRLEELLSEKGVRLYLGTVQYNPPERLSEIARNSGGDLITSK